MDKINKLIALLLDTRANDNEVIVARNRLVEALARNNLKLTCSDEEIYSFLYYKLKSDYEYIKDKNDTYYCIIQDKQEQINFLTEKIKKLETNTNEPRKIEKNLKKIEEFEELESKANTYKTINFFMLLAWVLTLLAGVII